MTLKNTVGYVTKLYLVSDWFWVTDESKGFTIRLLKYSVRYLVNDHVHLQKYDMSSRKERDVICNNYSHLTIQLTSSEMMIILSSAQCPSASIVFKLPVVMHKNCSF